MTGVRGNYVILTSIQSYIMPSLKVWRIDKSEDLHIVRPVQKQKSGFNPEFEDMGPECCRIENRAFPFFVISTTMEYGICLYLHTDT